MQKLYWWYLDTENKMYVPKFGFSFKAYCKYWKIDRFDKYIIFFASTYLTFG